VPYVRVQQLEKSIIWRFGEPKLIKFQRKRKFRIVTSKEKKTHGKSRNGTAQGVKLVEWYRDDGRRQQR
jgi:hypothetical protein